MPTGQAPYAGSILRRAGQVPISHLNQRRRLSGRIVGDVGPRVLRHRPAAVSIHAPFGTERGGPAVSGAAVGCPGEGLRPPFSLIGTKETAP